MQYNIIFFDEVLLSTDQDSVNCNHIEKETKLIVDNRGIVKPLVNIFFV